MTNNKELSITTNERMENKMSTCRKQGERVQKKPYLKPEVKRVELKPEEAVLGNCKVSGTHGPASTTTDCSTAGTCYSPGS